MKFHFSSAKESRSLNRNVAIRDECWAELTSRPAVEQPVQTRSRTLKSTFRGKWEAGLHYKLAVSVSSQMNGTHIYFLWTKCAPKIADEQSIPFNQNPATKGSSGCGWHRGVGKLPLYLKIQFNLKHREIDVPKRLWSSLCSVQSTNSSSQAPTYWIAHSHPACPVAPRLLWPLFLPLVEARLPSQKLSPWPNLSQAPLSHLFDQALPLGSILGLFIPVLLRVLLRYFSKNPSPLVSDHPQYLIKFLLSHLQCLTALVCLHQEFCCMVQPESSLSLTFPLHNFPSPGPHCAPWMNTPASPCCIQNWAPCLSPTAKPHCRRPLWIKLSIPSLLSKCLNNF